MGFSPLRKAFEVADNFASFEIEYEIGRTW